MSKDHPRFNTSPAFGYAGFVLPEDSVREFGRIFTVQKRKLFAREIELPDNPGQWERKGSDIFTKDAWSEYAFQIRVFRGLVKNLFKLEGKIFYYADEKEKGTDRQVCISHEEREKNALEQTVNRLCSYAERMGQQLFIIMDEVNEKQRRIQVQRAYAYIFARSKEHEEMRVILEPPMHVASNLSANVQFADWIAAAVNRAIDRQLIRDSQYMWVPDSLKKHMTGTITNESKLHLWQSSLPDLNHIDIFKESRPVIDRVAAAAMSPDDLRRLEMVKHAAERSRRK